MGIDMSHYKMIDKDQVFNVVGVVPYTEHVGNIAGENEMRVNELEASYIDENGCFNVINDKVTEFKFVRR